LIDGLIWDEVVRERDCCSFQLALQSEPNKLTIPAAEKGRGLEEIPMINSLPPAPGAEDLFILTLVGSWELQ
jgi:hypothetical protein